MAGLVPATHEHSPRRYSQCAVIGVFMIGNGKHGTLVFGMVFMDGRDEPGHDGVGVFGSQTAFLSRHSRQKIPNGLSARIRFSYHKLLMAGVGVFASRTAAFALTSPLRPLRIIRVKPSYFS